MTKKDYLRLILLLAAISAVHLLIPARWLALHVLFRLLYLLPIAYAGIRAGKNAGLITAFICTLLFLPHFFMASADAAYHAGNAVGVLIFFLTGYFTGDYRDKAAKGFLASRTRTYKPVSPGEATKILFYLETNVTGHLAANWLLDHMDDKPKLQVRLFSVTSSDVDDLFQSRSEAQQHVQEEVSTRRRLQDEIREILVNGGLATANIQEKVVRAGKKTRLSDNVLEELSNAEYSFVILQRPPITKSQEFLFGDMATKLVREAPVPVVVVKGEPEDAQQ